MRSSIKKVSLAGIITVLSLAFCATGIANADEAANLPGTSISITPVTKVLQLSPGNTYDDVLNVTNNGKEDIKIKIYAAPYSYVYSENDNAYTLGFNQENAYTQIVRWISVKDASGNYVASPTFTAKAGETIPIAYRISTPESIPSGGQYAVLFAQTVSDATNSSAVKTEASPGLVIFSRADGETITSAEFSGTTLQQTMETESIAEENGEQVKKTNVVNRIHASTKVKNTGNVDFGASGSLKVEGIFGGTCYETPSNKARISVIPESELTVADSWEETPDFGLFRVTWTVNAAGETETVEAVFFLVSPTIIIIAIILLTIIIVWIIIMVRKRKERRSRFAS